MNIMVAHSDKPVLLFVSVTDWVAWLEANLHHEGIRLQLRKKRSAAPGISHPQALEIALCFGWIDGQVSSLDDDYFLQAFTSRRPRSVWSQINRDAALALIAEGRLRAAGLAEVNRAQSDGRWDAAYRQKKSEVPADLQAALDASPAAAEFFRALTAQNRFAILFRLDAAKRAETRATKIATYIGMLGRGETLHPQKPRATPAGETSLDASL